MKKRQNLKKKPTYHFENIMTKTNQVFVWFDGLVKCVFKPDLFC